VARYQDPRDTPVRPDLPGLERPGWVGPPRDTSIGFHLCPRLEDGPSPTELGSASGPAAAGSRGPVGGRRRSSVSV